MNAAAPQLMIIAGEVSGDQHAARLVRSLQPRLPGATFFGIGGPELRAAGVETLYDIQDMAAVGLNEVVRRFGFFRRVFHAMIAEAERRRPDAVILVDYPGFNLRLARALHDRGIRTIYYVCPQVWAWNRGRIPRMARILDHLITLFPFEPPLFAGTGLDARFGGHPIVDAAREALAAPPPVLPWQGSPRVALLPGSRINEINMILPLIWPAAGLIEKQVPGSSFILATPDEGIERIVRDRLATLTGGPTRYAIVTGQTRQVLRQATATLVASGTATLETSLMGSPMVITYRLTPLSWHLCKALVRIPWIGMVNIVAGKTVCPEILQDAATPENLAAAMRPLLGDTPERASMLAELARVNAALGDGQAGAQAAAIVVEALSAPRRASAG